MLRGFGGAKPPTDKMVVSAANAVLGRAESAGRSERKRAEGRGLFSECQDVRNGLFMFVVIHRKGLLCSLRCSVFCVRDAESKGKQGFQRNKITFVGGIIT